MHWLEMDVDHVPVSVHVRYGEPEKPTKHVPKPVVNETVDVQFALSNVSAGQMFSTKSSEKTKNKTK